ncbi:MAG: pectin esterase, partial [Deinococcales bacterium]|nr:pectin esterase [Chitinophagaceae bacterium]
MQYYKKYIITYIAILAVVFLQITALWAQPIVVDITGKGNFITIQAAINSLPDSAIAPRTIFIKNGLYNEKVFITKHNIILKGESQEKT